jgi:hypothetical protein
MRTIVAIMLGMGLLTPAAQGAGDRDKALAVVEQAIKAHGGADALTKAQTRSRNGRGELTLSGNIAFKAEEIVSLPERCRTVLEAAGVRRVIVLNGDKGWMLTGGTTQEMNKELLAELREEPYVWWLMTLTPLQKDSFDLTPLPDAKVNGENASVIKVSHRGHADVRMFFDKKTGLLVKIARRAKEAGIPLDKEYSYSDYKEYDGVKLPTKEVTTVNGRKLSEVKFTDYQLLSKVEDKTFDKP